MNDALSSRTVGDEDRPQTGEPTTPAPRIEHPTEYGRLVNLASDFDALMGNREFPSTCSRDYLRGLYNAGRLSRQPEVDRLHEIARKADALIDAWQVAMDHMDDDNQIDGDAWNVWMEKHEELDSAVVAWSDALHNGHLDADSASPGEGS